MKLATVVISNRRRFTLRVHLAAVVLFASIER